MQMVVYQHIKVHLSYRLKCYAKGHYYLQFAFKEYNIDNKCTIYRGRKIDAHGFTSIHKRSSFYRSEHCENRTLSLVLGALSFYKKHDDANDFTLVHIRSFSL